MDWHDIATVPESTIVYIWWLPDGSMYVYYTPTHWAPVRPGDAQRDDPV